MTELLQSAIAAHGRQDAWKRLRWLDLHARIDGVLWSNKGQGGKLEDVSIRIYAHEQHVADRPFGGSGRHSVYAPDRVSVMDETGAALGRRDDPLASFADQVRSTPWDDLHIVAIDIFDIAIGHA